MQQIGLLVGFMLEPQKNGYLLFFISAASVVSVDKTK